MSRTYRPRPTQKRQCEHCQDAFLTNHARTKYCSDSCRVRAFYARQDKPLVAQVAPEAQLPVKAQLDFSWPNLGVGAASAGFVALLNQQLNDSPAHKKLLSRIDTLANQVRENQQQLSQHMHKQDAFVEAMKQVHLELQWNMNLVNASTPPKLSPSKDPALVRQQAELMLAKRKAKEGY